MVAFNQKHTNLKQRTYFICAKIVNICPQVVSNEQFKTKYWPKPDATHTVELAKLKKKRFRSTMYGLWGTEEARSDESAPLSAKILEDTH